MGYRVAVVGATGNVGREMLNILEEVNFPVDEIFAIASRNSIGVEVSFGDQILKCRDIEQFDFSQVDLVLMSVSGSFSKEWSPKIGAAGPIVIDNSSAWRMDPDVPLIVPEVNPEAAERHNGLIANPNCSTMQMVVALAPIERTVGIERIVISTYQSVSGTGQRAVDELEAQAHALLHRTEPPAPEIYPHRIAFNVVPQVENFKDGDDYTTEERKLMGETRKILELGEELGISATCVRVPVLVGHSQSVNVQTREPLAPEECRELLSAAPGAVVVDAPSEGVYPLAIDVAGRDDVLVGRIRRDPSHPQCLNLWVVGDNLRKGAATNAVQVAEILHQRDLIRVPVGAAALAG
jgi:aspartate-semialdehyde dehydrogenase